MEDEKLTYTLTVAAKTYLQRFSLIWTSLLSHASRVEAANSFALLVLDIPNLNPTLAIGRFTKH